MLMALRFEPSRFFLKGLFAFLRKNLLHVHVGSKGKAINIYFLFILQVLQVGKQFATDNSLFTPIVCVAIKSLAHSPAH